MLAGVSGSTPSSVVMRVCARGRFTSRESTVPLPGRALWRVARARVPARHGKLCRIMRTPRRQYNLFGWLRFTQTTSGQYQIWFFGFPLFSFPVDSLFAFVIIHALDFTAMLLLVGLNRAFHRRFHDLALIAVRC